MNIEPIDTVEWGEWGACDPGTCTRTRTELCMCLARIVSPAICWMDMATETEPCASGRRQMVMVLSLKLINRPGFLRIEKVPKKIR